MRKYANKLMADLATELTAGLLRLRKGYVDAALTLLDILDPSADYPYEFVVYRLTGFRPGRGSLPSETLAGRTLRGDLQRLILDICDSFELRPGDYAEEILDIPAISRKFNVAAKTIQRWRRGGLPALRLVFPDGKRRVAFLKASIDTYIRNRQSRIQRSMKFSQMTAAQRNDVIRRARRMATFTRCTLAEVSRRIAARSGRAVETIRYTIRKYDREHPKIPIFPYLAQAVADDEKQIIYRCFLGGVAAPSLAGRFRRTRGSIYRIVNEMRARQLMDRPLAYIYNPQFDLPNADAILLSAPVPTPAATNTDASADAKPLRPVKAPEDAVPYFKNLYDVNLLDPTQERDLFRRYNYLKYKADKLRKQIDLNHVRKAELENIDSLLLSANLVKNQLVRANLRLVVAIAKKHLGGPQSLFELISDGNVSLMRAVEKFDYSRGYRFSTYASWAIMRNFARTVPRERYQIDRFATGNEEILDIASGLKSYDPTEINLGELRESLDALLARLTPRERAVLIDHYGLDQEGGTRTFDELGQKLGISKERVRQIEMKALDKLRNYVRSPQM